MLGFGKKKKVTVDSLLDHQARIEGDVVFKGGMRIDGRVRGNVHGEGAGCLLIVGPNGFIEGQVQADDIVVEGEVRGPVTGTASVLIRSKGKIAGVVTYGRIQMEEGSLVEGLMQPCAPLSDRSNAKGSETADQWIETAPA